jgi:hypothetical protein
MGIQTTDLKESHRKEILGWLNDREVLINAVCGAGPHKMSEKVEDKLFSIFSQLRKELENGEANLRAINPLNEGEWLSVDATNAEYGLKKPEWEGKWVWEYIPDDYRCRELGEFVFAIICEDKEGEEVLFSCPSIGGTFEVPDSKLPE